MNLEKTKGWQKATRGVRTFLLSAFLLLALICFTKQETSAGNFDTNEDRRSIQVSIAIQIDQITDVNQKAENFSIVGNLLLIWQDGRFAYDSTEGEEKIYNARQFDQFVQENGLTWPRFIFDNQQGGRSVQEKIFVVRPQGEVTYFERFSVTLQAPDFNFHRYPFDIQKFDIHILSLHRANEYQFMANPNGNEMGSKLGEDEWIVSPASTAVATIQKLRGTNSRFSYSFTAKRHMGYYYFRIFLPLLLIVTVAYATFFMVDYPKRVDYSSANLLTFVMFNFAVGSNLPRLGYLTFIDSILVLAFITTAVTVITNVFIKRLDVTGRKNLVELLDKTMLWAYPVLYVGGVGILFFIYFY